MTDYQSLNRSTWECKYHVIFIPKFRKKAISVELRHHLGQVFRTLAEQKECRVEEGHLMADYVHMLLSVPPKYSVAQVVGYIKGKSAIHIARTFGERKRNSVGHHFWAYLGRSRLMPERATPARRSEKSAEAVLAMAKLGRAHPVTPEVFDIVKGRTERRASQP